MSELEKKVKEMIISELRLKLKPEEFKSDTQLFGSELGLDSIDALTLITGIEKHFNVAITDQGTGEKVLQNVNTIVNFLKEKGVK